MPADRIVIYVLLLLAVFAWGFYLGFRIGLRYMAELALWKLRAMLLKHYDDERTCEFLKEFTNIEYHGNDNEN